MLVVDDHPINRRLFELWLVRQGFAVDVAVNGQQALDCIGSGTAYSFVLMDCQMPVLDGLEATRQLRQREEATRGGRVPVIAITAGGGTLSERECLDAGMDAYLLKPVNFAVLQTLIERLQPLARG